MGLWRFHQTTHWIKYIFSFLFFFAIDYLTVYVKVCFWALYYVSLIYVSVFFSIIMHSWPYIFSVIWTQGTWYLQVCSFFSQDFISYLGAFLSFFFFISSNNKKKRRSYLCFHINFRIICSSFMKMSWVFW